MNRRTGETFIPLLPPPGETGVPLSAEIPGQEQFQEDILAQATLDYIKQANKRPGEEKIPLTPKGARIAAAVIADAIELSGGNVSIGLMAPKDLRRAIKTGLKIRSEERQRGKSVLHQLMEPSGPQGRQTGYDLAIPKELVVDGKLESYNYPTVPKPESLRRLIALTDERVRVVPETAKESLVEALGLPHRRGDPYGIIRYLCLPYLENSAVVTRGEVAARMISSRSSDYDRRSPLGIDKLKLLAEILSSPEADKEISAVAAAAAAELMSHQPEWVKPAKDALRDFGGQMRKTARYWKGAAPEGTTAGVQEAVDLAQIFAGVPIVPLAAQITWITRPEEITAGEAELGGKRHLWEKPRVLNVEGREVFLPNETTLAEALIQLRSVGADSNSLSRINAARRSWQKFERVVTRNPERIAEGKNRLGELFPQFAGLINLRPDEYPISETEIAARFRKSGGVISDKDLKAILQAVDRQETNLGIARSASAAGRRIKFYQKCLGDYKRWEKITMSLDDANEVGDRQLVEEILTEREGELQEEIKRLSPGLSRQEARLERPNIGTALYYWQTHPDQRQESWQGEAIPPSIEDADRQIELLERWINGINSEEASPFSIGLPLDAADPKLIDYLRVRLAGLPTSNPSDISRQAGRLMRAAKAIEAGAADRPVSNPLKTLIAEELDSRHRQLIGYRKLVADKQEKEAKLKGIEDARAGFRSGEDEKQAAALAGIDSPAKRKGVGRLARLKLVHREVRDNPDGHRGQLEAARELIGLHQRTKTFTFNLPTDPAGIPGEIERQRKRDLVTGRRAAEWSDESGAVSLPKGATAADIQKMLDVLQQSFKKENVFIPLKQAAGLTLGGLINAVSARVNVILAQAELPELEKEQARLAVRLETIRQEKDQAAALAKAKVLAKRIRGLENELLNAPKRLVAEMERQKLVLKL